MSDVYFLFAPKANVIKIGVARDPYRRVKNIQTPEKCRLVGLMPGVGVEGEQALHSDFATIRTHGEWFTATMDLRSYIEQHAKDVPVNAWEPVHAKGRGRARPKAQSTKTSGGRRNRAIEALEGDRIFFVYECYDATGNFLFVARSIKPGAHWNEHLRQSNAEWMRTVVRYRVRGPYTKSVANAMYRQAVAEGDPIHVTSAPTAAAAARARQQYFSHAMRARVSAGEKWDDVIMTVLEEADGIDFRGAITAEKAASCSNS